MKTGLTAALVVILFLGLSPFAEAQPELAAGAKIGANIGWFSGDGWDDLLEVTDGSSKSRGGITAAVLLEIGFSENFALQPELGVTSRRGGASIKFDPLGNPADGSITIKTTSIDISLLLKPRTAVGNGMIYALVGPHLFLLVGDSEVEWKVEGESGTDDFPRDNDFLFGVAVGAGYSHPVGPGSIVGDVVYTRAFNSVDDDADFFLNGIAIKVGYQFPF